MAKKKTTKQTQQPPKKEVNPNAFTRSEVKAIMVALENGIQNTIESAKEIKKMHADDRKDINEMFMNMKSARMKMEKFYGVKASAVAPVVTDQELDSLLEGKPMQRGLYEPIEPGIAEQTLSVLRDRIMEMLKKEDVAAAIYLHKFTNIILETPDGKKSAHGVGDYILHLTPSYSIMEPNLEGTGFVLQASKADYVGQEAERERDIAILMNMLTILLGPMLSHAEEMARMISDIEAKVEKTGDNQQ